MDGSKYTSTHNGASGVVGAMSTYQQNYKGTYTVTDWTVTASNRFDGKTQTFNAWFEIVRGGRVLHLQDQKNTGYHIRLVKTKYFVGQIIKLDLNTIIVYLIYYFKTPNGFLQ